MNAEKHYGYGQRQKNTDFVKNIYLNLTKNMDNKTNILTIILITLIASVGFTLFNLNKKIERFEEQSKRTTELIEGRVKANEEARWQLKGNLEQAINEFQKDVITDLNNILQTKKE